MKMRYFIIRGPVIIALPVQARTISRKDKQALVEVLHKKGFTVDGEHFEMTFEQAMQSVAIGQLADELPAGAIEVG